MRHPSRPQIYSISPIIVNTAHVIVLLLKRSAESRYMPLTPRRLTSFPPLYPDVKLFADHGPVVNTVGSFLKILAKSQPSLLIASFLSTRFSPPFLSSRDLCEFKLAFIYLLCSDQLTIQSARIKKKDDSHVANCRFSKPVGLKVKVYSRKSSYRLPILRTRMLV